MDHGMKAEILLMENSVRYGNRFVSRLLNEVNDADSLSGNGVQWFQISMTVSRLLLTVFLYPIL
jgi:hypothetical protein